MKIIGIYSIHTLAQFGKLFLYNMYIHFFPYRAASDETRGYVLSIHTIITYPGENCNSFFEFCLC